MNITNSSFVNMEKISVPKVLIVLGILLVLAGAGNQSNGGDNSFSLIGGVNFILGAIIYRSRKEQSKKKSTNWMIAEIISLIIIGLSIVPSTINGLWSLHPITFLISPIIIFGFYIYAFKKYKNLSS